LNKVVHEKEVVPVLLNFPTCMLWARYLPNVSLLGISLNPGKNTF
jgi:hypothetical protein